LIGWSLGGIYARELARQSPLEVRDVITLGSPFRLDGR
jgi:homoserine acetyltransferase